MAEIPDQAEKLLAVAPEDFVDARKELVRRLRDEGRREQADTISKIKKPSQVVLAVNRAARDRPQAAKDAAAAAGRLGKAQLSGKPDEYRALVDELERATGLLSEVAVANLSKRGKPTEATRRRVADHIRGALASTETRRLLARGVLMDEIEPAGFDALAGLPVPRSRARPRATREREAARERRAREKERSQAISDVSRRLADAERHLREATRERDKLARRLEELERKS
jgi:hypothetical protein